MKNKDLPVVLLGLEIVTKPEDASMVLKSIGRWLDGFMPRDAAKAIAVADKLGLREVVEWIALEGPQVGPTRTIGCHSLWGSPLISAWARGYCLEFDGNVDFEVDPDEFRRAIENGLPVKSLVLYRQMPNETLALCKDLKRIEIEPWGATGVVCPPTVEVLIANGDIEVDYSACLSLRVLEARCNPRIKTCPPTVEEIDVSGFCGITDVSECRVLRKLSAFDNRDIKACPPTVEELNAGRACGISDLSECHSLKVLDVSYNRKIKECPKSVVELDAFGSGIASLAGCVNLRKLRLSGPSPITECPESVVEMHNSEGSIRDFSRCRNLRKLVANHHKGPIRVPPTLTHLEVQGDVVVENLSECTRLFTLDVSENPNMTHCPTTVTRLIARGYAGITDLSDCRSLIYLDVTGNDGIQECPPLVMYLNASYGCGILDLSDCKRLVKLDLTQNKLIRDISACRKLRVLICSGCELEQYPASLEALKIEYGPVNCDLQDLDKLRILMASENRDLGYCPPSVEILDASNTGIRDLRYCPKLRVVVSNSDIKMPKRTHRHSLDYYAPDLMKVFEF